MKTAEEILSEKLPYHGWLYLKDMHTEMSEGILLAMELYRSQASDLPSDGITKFTEKEIDAAKSVRDSFLNQAGVERYKQVYMAGEIVMSDQLQPILASHVARILELEESKIIANGFYVVARNSEEDWEQITQQMDSLEKAKDYLNDTFCKQKYPYAFIVAKII